VTEWVSQAVVLAIHDQQIAEHGGRNGLRDLPTLESSLARPQNLLAYGDPPPDIAALAASYAFGIAAKQAFVDGNKRTSAVVTATFLLLNGYDFTADEATRLQVWLDIGNGSMSEHQLTEWLRANIRKVAKRR
jgi:death on curing protein